MIQAENLNTQVPVPRETGAAENIKLQNIFLFSIVLGGIIGAFANFHLCNSSAIETQTQLLVLFCGFSVGGTTGMLVSLLAHVIFMGSLEEDASLEV